MSVLEETFQITQPMDAADYLYELLKVNGPSFGLENVEYNSRLIRQYPAAVVVPGRKDKIFRTTAFFEVILEVVISVYHARFNDSHRERTRDDLQLCTDIEATIETGQLNISGRVVVMYVSEIVPGLITRSKGEQVVGTRMNVTFMNRERMSKGA